MDGLIAHRLMLFVRMFPVGIIARVLEGVLRDIVGAIREGLALIALGVVQSIVFCA
jgi:hypothetical protein